MDGISTNDRENNGIPSVDISSQNLQTIAESRDSSSENAKKVG